MKSLVSLINERLKLNKDSKIGFVFDENDYRQGIKYLKSLTNKKGLYLEFNKYENIHGNFHFLLYKKSNKEDCIECFHGDWSTMYNVNPNKIFVVVCKEVEEWINSYK